MRERVGMIRFWMVFLVVLSWAGLSEAGLFCVVDFAGKRCMFNDLESCRQAAGKQGGCVLNESEIAKPFGASPYCLVESWRTECVYPDMASCEKRATTTRTVCMANPNLAHNAPFGQQMQGMHPAGMQGMQPGGMQQNFNKPPGFPGATNLPSSGGVTGSGYVPNTGYWPGTDK